MSRVNNFSPPARRVLVAGACALVIGLLKLAAPVLEPILLGIFIAIIATPGLQWLRRHGVPKWVALALITFLLVQAGSLFALLTTGAVEGFRESFPGYQARFIELSEQFGHWAESVGIGGSTEALPDLLDPAKVSAGVRLLLSSASSLFAEGFLIILIVVFTLLEAPTFPTKLAAAFDMGSDGAARLQRVLGSVNHYMRIKCGMALLTAAGAWLMLWVFGIDFALLWAILTFLLYFIPVVGGIVMMVPPVFMALVVSDWQTTLLVAGGYVALNIVIGEILETKAMGKGLGISALTVLIALLFWGWLFDIVGMFLAVPLTTALVIALDASPHTRPLAILLASGPEPG